MRPHFSHVVLLLLCALVGCNTAKEEAAAPLSLPDELMDAPAPRQLAPSARVSAKALASFAPLPDVMRSASNKVTQAKAALGKALFHEKRVSKNHDVSCNTCHALEKYGVDGTPVSVGHKGVRGQRNSPTVYNAALQHSQFWDGRADSIEAQAIGPMTNPIEMAMADHAAIEAVLRSIPGYAPLFKAAFPGDSEPITIDNVAKAIGAFERMLVTPSRWDRYLNGDDKALSAAERQGFADFVAAGCATCHKGPLLGGTLMRELGSTVPFTRSTDVGRFAVTGKEKDRGVFKVAQLRNIARTAPYGHDGGIATLEEAVQLMSVHQLGRELQPSTVASIVTFLIALTGDIPAIAVGVPTLPASGPQTPVPDPT